MIDLERLEKRAAVFRKMREDWPTLEEIADHDLTWAAIDLLDWVKRARVHLELLLELDHLDAIFIGKPEKADIEKLLAELKTDQPEQPEQPKEQGDE